MKVLTPVALVAAFTAGPAFAQSAPPPADDFTARVAARIASAVSDPPRGEHSAPPVARNPSAPATLLFGVLATLEEVQKREEALPRWPESGRVFTDRSHRAVARALALHGTAGDPSAVMDALAEAARALEPLRRSSVVHVLPQMEQAAYDVAVAAGAIAGGLVRVAEAAGASSPSAAIARRRLDQGMFLLGRGQYVAAVAQFGGAASFASNGVTFDIDRFEQNIRGALAGQTVGHAWTIVRDGLLHRVSDGAGAGVARNAADAPETAQSAFKEMYLASHTKTISALALLKALSAAGISVDEGIAGYLPDDWMQGPGLGAVTFRHLLTHRSGLDQAGLSGGTAAGQSFDALRQIVATGTPGILGLEQAVYTNANFSLLRILIPRIVHGPLVIAYYVMFLPEDVVYAELYSQYVQFAVFGPAGINALLCAPREALDTRTRYYAFSSPATPGVDWGDWGLSCGATGYYLSAVELGALLAFLRYTDAILDVPTRQLMNAGYLGWLNPVTFSGLVEGVFGAYRAHGGDIGVGGNPGMTGCMMNFPIHVEATLLINSRGGSLGGHACTLLRDAYDNAWTKP